LFVLLFAKKIVRGSVLLIGEVWKLLFS